MHWNYFYDFAVGKSAFCSFCFRGILNLSAFEVDLVLELPVKCGIYGFFSNFIGLILILTLVSVGTFSACFVLSYCFSILLFLLWSFKISCMLLAFGRDWIYTSESSSDIFPALPAPFSPVFSSEAEASIVGEIRQERGVLSMRLSSGRLCVVDFTMLMFSSEIWLSTVG